MASAEALEEDEDAPSGYPGCDSSENSVPLAWALENRHLPPWHLLSPYAASSSPEPIPTIVSHNANVLPQGKSLEDRSTRKAEEPDFLRETFGCTDFFPWRYVSGIWHVFEVDAWSPPTMFPGCLLSQLFTLLETRTWKAGL